MLFQLLLRKGFKSELFSCLPKVDHVIKSCKEPITMTNLNALLTQIIQSTNGNLKQTHFSQSFFRIELGATTALSAGKPE